MYTIALDTVTFGMLYYEYLMVSPFDFLSLEKPIKNININIIDFEYNLVLFDQLDKSSRL